MSVNTDMGTMSENNVGTLLRHSAYLWEFTTGSKIYPFFLMFAKLSEVESVLLIFAVRPVKALKACVH